MICIVIRYHVTETASRIAFLYSNIKNQFTQTFFIGFRWNFYRRKIGRVPVVKSSLPFPFKQYGQRHADPTLQEGSASGFCHLLHGKHSIMFDIVGYLVGAFSRWCADTWGIPEYMDFCELHRFGKGERFCKVCIRFAGKADHQVGGNGADRKPLADGMAEGGIFGSGIPAVHFLQRAVTAALQR